MVLPCTPGSGSCERLDGFGQPSVPGRAGVGSALGGGGFWSKSRKPQKSGGRGVREGIRTGKEIRDESTSQGMPGVGLSYEGQNDTRRALLRQNCSGQCEQDAGVGEGLRGQACVLTHVHSFSRQAPRDTLEGQKGTSQTQSLPSVEQKKNRSWTIGLEACGERSDGGGPAADRQHPVRQLCNRLG